MSDQHTDAVASDVVAPDVFSGARADFADWRARIPTDLASEPHLELVNALALGDRPERLAALRAEIGRAHV